MSLTGVEITPEVWLTCVTHALSTETEEVMGLLLGDVEYLENGSVVAQVWSAAPQTRSDRRKDRVETNPEQLAAATAEAEISSPPPMPPPPMPPPPPPLQPAQAPLLDSALARHVLSASTGRTTRVIGWYHSHPHITVLPSHVGACALAPYPLKAAPPIPQKPLLPFASPLALVHFGPLKCSPQPSFPPLNLSFSCQPSASGHQPRSHCYQPL
eukprot:jgi/Mesen1/7264/ME000373S06337